MQNDDLIWQVINKDFCSFKAKDVIEKEMKNVYKSHQIERCKRRAAKLNRMLDRMRRMELEVKERLVPVKKKTERREAVREKKAEVAARLEDVIELELMRRLQQGVYGSLYKNEKFERNETERPRVQAYSTQRIYEPSGCVTVKHSTQISETDMLDAELLERNSQAGGEATASLATGTLGNLPKPANDVEDLAVDWSTEETRGNFSSCSVPHSRAEGPSPRKKACKRWGGFSMVKRNPATQKLARFFDVEGVRDTTGTAGESYEDSGELLHN